MGSEKEELNLESPVLRAQAESHKQPTYRRSANYTNVMSSPSLGAHFLI